MGKPKKTSLPYAPGATPVFTVNTYDALGRTLSTVAPDGSSTTSYVYQGNTVKVTDPAGKWKLYTMDAFGQLVQVVEPSPDANPNHVTTYLYDVLGHLMQAQMPRTVAGNVVTQTRTWNYDPATQRLTSVTQPETGTVSFTYNGDGTLATKTDANSGRTQYTYDSYAELTQIARGGWNAGTSTFTEDVSERVTYTYGGTNPTGQGQGQSNYSSNTAGRVSQITYSGPHNLSFSEWYSYTAPGGVTAKRLTLTSGYTNYLDAYYSYDSEGRMTSVQYPQQPGGSALATYTYGFDAMGRLNTMTDQNNNSLVSGVTYNAANKLLTLSGTVVAEARTYNVNQQLTELYSGAYHFKYNYSATQNNGRIQSMTDVASGETVTYAYDTLNRLITASGAGDAQGNWSQAFGYDGFGNLLSKTGVNAPNVTSWVVDPTTNRITNNGALYYANGNLGQYAGSFYGYDIANRLVMATPQGGSASQRYAYDSSNHRIYAGTTSDNINYTNEQIYFYGADGKKLGVWSLTWLNSAPILTNTVINQWFGGRLLKPQDRLQSNGKYFPYGEDRYSPNPANPANDQEKFATYTRDSGTGLDYANQRYYAAGLGRFATPDPFGGSASPTDPQSMNRYSYVKSDPVNLTDPTGMIACGDLPVGPNGVPNGTVGDYTLSGSAQSHFIDLVWHESGTLAAAGSQGVWDQEFALIAQSIENRLLLSLGAVWVQGEDSHIYYGPFTRLEGSTRRRIPLVLSYGQSRLGYSRSGSNLNNILYQADGGAGVVNASGGLNPIFLLNLIAILNSDEGDVTVKRPNTLPVTTYDSYGDASTIYVSAQCYGVIDAIQYADGVSANPLIYDSAYFFPTSWRVGDPFLDPNYKAGIEYFFGQAGPTDIFGFRSWGVGPPQ